MVASSSGWSKSFRNFFAWHTWICIFRIAGFWKGKICFRKNRANFGWGRRSPKPLCYRLPDKPTAWRSLHLPVGLNPSKSPLPGTHGFEYPVRSGSRRGKICYRKNRANFGWERRPPNPSATALQLNRPQSGRFIFRLV